MIYDYDLIILGSIEDNLSAIEYALSLNARIGLIHYPFSRPKSYLNNENFYQLSFNSQDFLTTQNNLDKLKYQPQLSQQRVDFIDKDGVFNPQEKKVTFQGEKNRYQASSYLLNIDRNVLFDKQIPSIFKKEKTITIDQLINENQWQDLPENLAVVGNQVSAIYTAQKLITLGKNVSLYTDNDSLLPTEDEDISWQLQLYLEAIGIKIYPSGEFTPKYLSEIVNNHELAIVDSIDDRLEEDDNLNLQKIGVKFDRHGAMVNSKLQTDNKNIFACGDILGGYNRAGITNSESKIAVFNALFGSWREVHYDRIPYSLNTNPPIFRLGYTEKQGRMLFGNSLKIISFHPDYNSIGVLNPTRTQTPDEIFYLKIILDSQQRILGIHSIGKIADFMGVITRIFEQNQPFHSLFKAHFNQQISYELVKQIWQQYYDDESNLNNYLTSFRKTFFIWKKDIFKK